MLPVLPLLQCFREERTFVLMKSPLGYVARCAACRAGPLRENLLQTGFLEEASIICLSRSAASSAAPALFFPRAQFCRAVCPWTSKPLPLPAFLKHPVKLSYSRPEAIEKSSLPHVQQVIMMFSSKPVSGITAVVLRCFQESVFFLLRRNQWGNIEHLFCLY